jgi:modified peptide precursor CbpA
MTPATNAKPENTKLDTKPIDAKRDAPAEARPEVIALRKTCDAEGTGLSHYVLMDKQVTR